MAKSLAGKILSKGAEKLEVIFRVGICDKRSLYIMIMGHQSEWEWRRKEGGFPLDSVHPGKGG